MSMCPLAVFMYVAVALFIAGIARMARRYATMPMHLRWELYPVPHEVGHEHGGSYLEYVEWWNRKFPKNRLAEISELLKELLFIVRLYRGRRTVWCFSFPFHGGVYLLLLWGASLVLLAVSGALIPADLHSAVSAASLALGYLGAAAATFGIAGLTALRLTRTMRMYTTPLEYFNNTFILVVLVSGFLAASQDPSFSTAVAFVRHMLGGPAPELPPLVAAHVILLGLLVIYIPYTKIAHFIGKYFTYHKVLWDSEPLRIGGAVNEHLNRKILEALSRHEITWSAPHIPRGRKWAEVGA
ncbi:MAG: nitrate reductase [Thermoproteaceae archaeon]|nr:nitrate reductase [Thermoproteaceae archaeon]